MINTALNGKVGLGFRRGFSKDFLNKDVLNPAFIEVAPENWMGIGGYWKKIFNQVTEKYPVVCHGLSLSIGSPEPIEWDFLKEVKAFLNEYNVEIYSEHLSFSKCENAHTYELLPIPFREDAAKHVAQRIREVQDFLERPLAIEIASYYTSVAAEMSELDFINMVLEEADCKLLLDVNNVYVNSFNHGFNPKEFLKGLQTQRTAYIHMAGHKKVQPDLIIDTHGQPIVDPVYELFEWTLENLHPVPVLLERDYNYDDYDQLQNEINTLQKICDKQWKPKYVDV